MTLSGVFLFSVILSDKRSEESLNLSRKEQDSSSLRSSE